MSETEGTNPIETKSSVSGDVARLVTLITNAQTASEVEDLQAQLLALIPLAHGDSVTLGVILKAIGSAQSKLRDLEKTEHDARSTRIMESQFLDTDTKNIYKALDESNCLTDADKAFLDEIKPGEEYHIPTLDADGNAVKGQTKTVQGWQIQEAFIISKAQENRNRLSQAGRESLDSKVLSMASAEGTISVQVINDASRLVQGYRFAYGRTWAGTEEVNVEQRNHLSALADLLTAGTSAEKAAGSKISTRELALKGYSESLRSVPENPKNGIHERQGSVPQTTIRHPENDAVARQEQKIVSLAGEMNSTSLPVKDPGTGISPQELTLKRLADTLLTAEMSSAAGLPPTPRVSLAPAAVTSPEKPSVPPVAPAKTAIAEADAFAGMIDNPAIQTQPTTRVLPEEVKAAVATIVAQQQPQPAVLPPLPTPPKPAPPAIQRESTILTSADGSLSISKSWSPTTGPTLKR